MFLDYEKSNPLLSHFLHPCPPTEFARARNAEFLLSPYSAPSARPHLGLSKREVSFCDVIVSFARTFFKENT
jgi:hypothetical protein